MKKKYFLPVLAVMLLVAACGGGGSSSPRRVADKFTQAFLVEFDLDKARRYVAEDLKEEFPSEKGMNEIEKMFFQVLKDHAQSYGYQYVLNEECTEIGEDKAYVEYVLTANANPEFREGGCVDLARQEDGRWIITKYSFDRDSNAIDFGF